MEGAGCAFLAPHQEAPALPTPERLLRLAAASDLRSAQPSDVVPSGRVALAVLAGVATVASLRLRGRRVVRPRRRVLALDMTEQKVAEQEPDPLKPSPILKVKRRPPKVTMSKRTPLEEPPTVDFLEKCLAAGRLEQADQITRDLIIALAGPNALARGFALPSEVKNLRTADLRAIDSLWLRHSGGKLGYSVQRNVWHEVKKDPQSFMQSIGWLMVDPSSSKALLRYWPRRQFDYTSSAPKGHLPLTNMIRGRDLLMALLEHPAWESSAVPDSESTSEAQPEATKAWFAEITGAGENLEEEEAEAAGTGRAALVGATGAFDGAVTPEPSPVVSAVEAVAAAAAAASDQVRSNLTASSNWLDALAGWVGSLFQAISPPSSAPPPPPSVPRAAKAELVASSGGLPFDFRGPGTPNFRVTLITGFETFNVRLYSEAACRGLAGCEGLQVCLFTDKDLETRRELVQAALAETDVLFCSLVFDYDQAEWLRTQIQSIPIRFIFESALELMSCTKVGDFSMAGGGGKGAPPAVRSMLSMLTGTREEDRIAGYTKFLKAGPKLLRFLPQVGPLPDLRRWLQTYAYWSGGGAGNVAKMLRYIGREFAALDVGFGDLLANGEGASDEAAAEPTVVEIPSVGLLHPALKFATELGPFFDTPEKYLEWYRTYKPEAFTEKWPVCAVLLFRKHIISELPYIPQLVNFLEERHKLLPLPIFIQGVDAHIAVRDLLTSRFEREAVAAGRQAANPTLSPGAVEVDCVVNTIGFPLVGGPAGSMEGGRNAEIAKEILSSLNVPYVVAAPLLIQDVASWKEEGIGGLQGVVLYALPELDGAIDTVPLGGLLKNTGEIELLPDRADRLAERLRRWVRLRQKPRSERKVAVVLYGYPPGLGAAGTAALLNVPQSLRKMLLAMKAQGYDVGDLPEDPEEVLKSVREADLKADMGQSFRNAAEEALGSISVTAESLAEWLPKSSQEAIESNWGKGLTRSGIRTMGGSLLLGGRRYGNVWIGVQPPLGVPGDPMRLLFERDMTPHPQYVAFYKHLENDFGADAVVHFGMHGTAEWLPGRPLGNTATCWPDQLLGGMPNVYLYAANNPSESILAKRRGYGCLVSHNVPPYARAGLYRELLTLRGLLAELAEKQGSSDSDANIGAAAAMAGAAAGVATAASAAATPSSEAGAAALTLEGAILQAVFGAGLEKDVPLPAAALEALAKSEAAGAEEDTKAEAAAAAMRDVQDEDGFTAYSSRLRRYIAELEATLFSAGLHTLGEKPEPASLRAYLSAYFDGEGRPALPEAMLERISQGADAADVRGLGGLQMEPLIHEAISIRELLNRNDEELESMLRALNGEYILPAPGGDLLRDGAGVLPTGRNIHALDPYRIPSKTAMSRGVITANASVQQHLKDFGSFPETIAVNLWGLEAIKTRGESVAVVLGLIGARPVEEATGRVVRYELIPLEELQRPRVDALCSLSGIFRDSFSNVVELLDDVLRRAAEAEDEPPEKNFIRKHFLELKAKGESEDGAASRIFSNAAGEFGSLVNERVSAGSWEGETELGETWAQRNAFAFGRGQRGTERRKVLDSLMASTGSVVQLTDSIEYGLTDIQEYYANTGAMVRKMGDLQGRKVDALIVETTQKEVKPKKLDAALRMEYRTKLLNPKWAETMVASGSGGAFEVSQRMTALLGWGATAKFQESWVWDQGVEQYVFDAEMAKKLRDSNPEAFRNIVGRFIEASNRGMWTPAEDVMSRLKEVFEELEDEMEGVA